MGKLKRVLIILGVLTACTRETSRPEAVDREFARGAAASMQRSGFVAATALMHYPPTESPSERRADEQGVERLLQLAEAKIGRLEIGATESLVPLAVFVANLSLERPLPARLPVWYQ